MRIHQSASGNYVKSHKINKGTRPLCYKLLLRQEVKKVFYNRQIVTQMKFSLPHDSAKMAIIHEYRDPSKLDLTSESIGRKTIKTLLTLAANLAHGFGVLVQIFTGNTNAALSSGRATKRAVAIARNGGFNTTRSDINSALVGGVPVASDWRVLGKRQVGLHFFNLLVLVLAVLVDDRLIHQGLSELFF